MPPLAPATSLASSAPAEADPVIQSPPERPEAALRRALDGAYEVRPAGRTRETTTHLDTADRRLLAAGIDLSCVPRPNRLVAQTSGVTLEQPTGAARWPALVANLPAGPVRDLIAGPAWIRALLPYATSKTHRQAFAVMNEDGKTVVRLAWSERVLLEPRQLRLPAAVRVEPLRGYARDGTEVSRLLGDAALPATERAWLDELAALPERPVAGARLPSLAPEEPAAVAVAVALLGYLAEIDAAVDGIVGDVDTEFLHDFRVAVRRTRSVLKLLGDVLPSELGDHVAREFRWLGEVTSPTRDLDVYLLKLAGMAATVSQPADLEAFGRHIRARRAAAHRSLARSLRSARFADLTARWRAELAAVVAITDPGGQTAHQLAEDRIHRTYAKVAKRAKSITAESSSEKVHALRKACKELRYLLEVFRPLCHPKAYRRVIADFKELQDVLGDYQDGDVQAAALRQFAAEMVAAGTGDAPVLLAMGALSGRFEARQRQAREALMARHLTHLGRRTADHIDQLMPA